MVAMVMVVPEVNRAFIKLCGYNTSSTNTTHDAVFFGGLEIVLNKPSHVVEIAAQQQESEWNTLKWL